jgi:hypothetical protein
VGLTSFDGEWQGRSSWGPGPCHWVKADGVRRGSRQVEEIKRLSIKGRGVNWLEDSLSSEIESAL